MKGLSSRDQAISTRIFGGHCRFKLEHTGEPPSSQSMVEPLNHPSEADAGLSFRTQRKLCEQPLSLYDAVPRLDKRSPPGVEGGKRPGDPPARACLRMNCYRLRWPLSPSPTANQRPGSGPSKKKLGIPPLRLANFWFTL